MTKTGRPSKDIPELRGIMLKSLGIDIYIKECKDAHDFCIGIYIFTFLHLYV